MLRVLVAILVVGVVFFAWIYPAGEKILESCAEPIKYTIGSFDRRFNIAYSDFLSALAEAETVWETVSNQELFTYSPEDGALSVNLIYDYRQEVTNELSKIESAVENSETTYRALENEYLTLKKSHATLEALYQSRLALFNQHNAAYEESVEAWNRSSRTDKQEFQALELERQAQEREFAELKNIEAELNRVVRDVNTIVGRLNRLAKALNLNVEVYNTVGASRGETFAGGIYSAGVEGEEIDIYEFSSREKLVRVLAHELGHALGLEHIDDPDAIMYYQNVGEADALTEADIESLKTLCQIN